MALFNKRGALIRLEIEPEDKILELGRQSGDDPPPPAMIRTPTATRIVIVDRTKVEIGRNQLRIEVLASDNVRLTNMSKVSSVAVIPQRTAEDPTFEGTLPDVSILGPGNALDFRLPLLVTRGIFSLVLQFVGRPPLLSESFEQSLESVPQHPGSLTSLTARNFAPNVSSADLESPSMTSIHARTSMKIFISYRRDDAAYPAQFIHEKLAAHFGAADVFIDIDHIPVGINFHDYINEAVGKCDILLAIIGDHWLDAQDKAGGRRLDDANDLVRIEIEAALTRKIPVVPVLVGKASVPQSLDLPLTLRELTLRHATEVRAGRDFWGHLERLVQGIERTLVEAKNQATKQDAR